MSRKKAYNLIPGDWPHLESIIKELGYRVLDSPTSLSAIEATVALKTDKSVQIIAGTGLSGGGTLSENRTLSVSTNLASLSGLTFSSEAFVKMTAAGTFALDTEGGGSETDPVFTAWLGTVTPANWNTAYSQTLEWNGGSTNLVAATGRTSLGLGSAATHDATDFQSGTLTATRIPFATGSPGTLTDSANLTFDGTNVTGTGHGRFDTGVGVGGAPSETNGLFYILSSSATASKKGLAVNITCTKNSGVGGAGTELGLSFSTNWSPAALSANLTTGVLGGAFGGPTITTAASESHNPIVTQGYGYLGRIYTVDGSGATGHPTYTTAAAFWCQSPGLSILGICTHNYAFYDAGQYLDGTRTPDAWGIGINTPNNYINGSLSVGKNTAPAYNIDVTGDINCTGAFRSGGTAGINATVTYVDTLLGTKTLTFTKGILTAQV
jgi:hypothetical protein